VPESQSKTDQLVCPAVVPCGFAQLVDISNDGIHCPVKHIDTALGLPALVLVGDADALRMGRIPRTRQAYGRDMTLLSLLRQATVEKKESATKYNYTV
jgi:hypothetical protein